MLRTQKVKRKEKVLQGSRRSRMGGVLGVRLFGAVFEAFGLVTAPGGGAWSLYREMEVN